MLQHFENWLVPLGAFYRAILDSILFESCFSRPELVCLFLKSCKLSCLIKNNSQNCYFVFWNKFRIHIFRIWCLIKWTKEWNQFRIEMKKEMFIRWVSVVEFHDWELGIGKVFGQESTVVKWNYQTLSLHLVTVCQKVPILDFQSEFSMSKIIRIFLKKFHWRISI